MTEREKIIETLNQTSDIWKEEERHGYIVSVDLEKIADALIAAGIGDTTNLIVENEVLQRALLTACVNLIKDEKDNVNMELLAHVVYTKFLRKAEKELAEEKKMKYKKDSDKSWLASCPPNDGNFKCHLKTATKQDLQELIAELPEQGNITKIKALKAELKRREKQ